MKRIAIAVTAILPAIAAAQYVWIPPPPPPASICVTPVGSCPMVQLVPIGSACTCFNGPVAAAGVAR